MKRKTDYVKKIKNETEKLGYVTSKRLNKRTSTWSRRMQRAVFTYSPGVHFSSPSCTEMTRWMRGRTPGAAGDPIDIQQAFTIQGVSVLSG